MVRVWVSASNRSGHALFAVICGLFLLVVAGESGLAVPASSAAPQALSFRQEATLSASSANAQATLGGAVAISARTIVVGAPGANVSGKTGGAVYVYSEPSSGWASASKPVVLTAVGGQDDDELGTAVAISGRTIVASAPGAAGGAGAVYVFTEPAAGWAGQPQAAELTANGSVSLGTSVAIEGNTVVAGAPFTTVKGIPDRGAVFVFNEPATGWANEGADVELTSSTGAKNDQLGWSVAISGGTIVGGAPQANSFRGVAYVFSRSAAGWTNETQAAKLTVPANGAQGNLGRSIAISGDLVVAGAPGASVAGAQSQGAAFLFAEPSGRWQNEGPVAELTASDGAADDGLGFDVGVSGSIVIAGAPFHAGYSGAGYVFARPAGGWRSETETAEVAVPHSTPRSQLGNSTTLSGKTLVVGAPLAAVDGHQQEGVVYVFGSP